METLNYIVNKKIYSVRLPVMALTVQKYTNVKLRRTTTTTTTTTTTSILI